MRSLGVRLALWGFWVLFFCAFALPVGAQTSKSQAEEKTFVQKRKRLEELPEELSARTDWKWVDLRSNRLSYFPVELADFDSLETLRLGGNPLDWGDSLSGFQTLEYLDLWDTDVDSVPVFVSGFQSLKKLDLRNTYLDERNREELQRLFPNAEILLSERCDCRPKR